LSRLLIPWSKEFTTDHAKWKLDWVDGSFTFAIINGDESDELTSFGDSIGGGGPIGACLIPMLGCRSMLALDGVEYGLFVVLLNEGEWLTICWLQLIECNRVPFFATAYLYNGFSCPAMYL
jgi:hypothetical protein